MSSKDDGKMKEFKIKTVLPIVSGLRTDTESQD